MKLFREAKKRPATLHVQISQRQMVGPPTIESICCVTTDAKRKSVQPLCKRKSHSGKWSTRRPLRAFATSPPTRREKAPKLPMSLKPCLHPKAGFFFFHIPTNGPSMPDTQTAVAQTPDIKSALAGFTEDFKGFRTDLEARLTRQSCSPRRAGPQGRRRGPPRIGAGGRPRHTAPQSLRRLCPSGRRGPSAQLGHRRESAQHNGPLPMAASSSIRKPPRVLRPSCARPRRSVPSLERCKSTRTAYDALIDRTEMGAGWITEADTIADTATPAIDRVSIPLHELNATPKASQRLLDDSAFDVEGWLAERIATRFARAENAAFISGDGVDKPKGFLAHNSVANSAWGWGNIGHLTTGAAGAFGAEGGDTLIDLVYALGAGYRANASFVMNSATAGEVRKLKDSDGRYLWAESLTEGQPARLLGYPVAIAEEMPEIADGADAIAFGDFRSGYTVAERPDLRILRDPYSAKPHVLFYATKRVGGDVTDFAAIKLLRFAA